MSIKVKSFLGPIGFELRKVLPQISSNLYLQIESKFRARESREYIKKRLEEGGHGNIYPLYIAIETINRCNGECAFCPANIHSEKRKFAKMSDDLFDKIINEIASWSNWTGVFSLYVNNEPFIDKRMREMLLRARTKLPNAQMLLFSNGTLLTPDIMDIVAETVDVMYINNYSTKYRLNDNIKKIYKYVKNNKERFEKIKIVIQKRYQLEYLTNRAGNAPNKIEAINRIVEPCLVPYTDLTIYPNGQVGLCCSDYLESIDFGNVTEKTIVEIYNNDKFKKIREKMEMGRKNIDICSNCDFIDSGIRLKMMKGKT